MAVGGNEESGSFVLQIKQTFFFPWSYILPPKPFKFVPDRFLAGALSFTVPSTYITSQSGCWIDWWNSCPWFRGWHLYRGSWESQISRTWLLLHLYVIFAECRDDLQSQTGLFSSMDNPFFKRPILWHSKHLCHCAYQSPGLDSYPHHQTSDLNHWISVFPVVSSFCTSRVHHRGACSLSSLLAFQEMSTY